MSENPFDSVLGKQPTEIPMSDCKHSNAVCISANRIYDSCGAKDCLSNLSVYFTEANQTVIRNAVSVRICRASVITSTVDVEPVAFHRGFYAVDVNFYFDVTIETYACGTSIPTTINGLAIYGKRVVLYGSEGNAKTFSSDLPVVCAENDTTTNCACNVQGLPTATVHISDPMALSASLTTTPSQTAINCNIPDCVENYFGAPLVVSTDQGIVVTIGLFTITQLERNVQLMVPSYDFCVPRRECKPSSDDPCEMFNRIEFPNESFFPPNAQPEEREKYSFECDCRK